MLKFKIKKTTTLNILLIFLAFTITIICSISGYYNSETKDLAVGMVSPKKFIAKEEIINEVATKRNMDKAISEMSPLYTKDSTIQNKVIKEIVSFLDYIRSNSEQKRLLAPNTQIAPENNKTENPEKTDNNIDTHTNNTNSHELSSKIYLSSNQTNILSTMNDAEFKEFKNVVLQTVNSAFEQGIREDNEDKILIYVKSELSESNLSDELLNIGYSIISNTIEPNMILDVTATEKAKEEKISSIKPVMVLKNQKIVDSGEIISEEIYSLLYSAGYIQKDNFEENIIPLFGTALLILSVFTMTLLYIYKFHKKLYTRKNEALLLFTLYTILTILTKLLANVPYMFIPVLSFTMLLAMLLNYRLAIILNFSVCIIYYIAFNFSTSFLIYFSTTGMFTAFMANLIKENKKIFKLGLLNCIAGVFIITGITLYINKNFNEELLKNCFLAFLNGILTLIICIGSMPIWDFVFDVITQYKLLELINPDKPLLKKLMLECPGTYNHSLIVANLAEAAALEIGANSALAKVGSYYHDIGKLKYPQYFSENIRGKNPHDSMNPYTSAKIVSSHVTAGIEYAEKYKLPSSIKYIIAQHHGNTLISFFYIKAKQNSEGKEINEADFRYKQQPPQTKETAIIMLADTVEAAVRSKNETNLEEIKKFVHQLIKGKLDDGQFNQCSLKISDLNKIENAFMKVLSGMYHERVPYPTDKKDDSQDLK